MKKILLVEDESPIAKGIKIHLDSEHFLTDIAEDGEIGYNYAMTGSYDLIILDVMLPKINGFDVCHKLREGGIFTPIIMLTSKKEEDDRINGLDMGADDYITKPFSIKELSARINAVLRRTNVYQNHQGSFCYGDIKVDFNTMEVYKKDCRLKLSATEFNILKYFCLHEGEVITRNKFLDDVWGYDSYPTTRTVDNYILSLRKKIEDDPAHPKNLVTIHTKGYKFTK